MASNSNVCWLLYLVSRFTGYFWTSADKLASQLGDDRNNTFAVWVLALVLVIDIYSLALGSKCLACRYGDSQRQLK